MLGAAMLASGLTAASAHAQDTFHITHQYANLDARSMIGLPMGSHKTIVTKDGQLLWSQWSLAQKGRAVLFGFSDQLDGALGIHMSETGGDTSKPMGASGQHLDGMRYPFIVTDWKGDSLSAAETAFAATEGKVNLDVVRLRVANSSDRPRTFELKLNGRQRNLPAHATGSHLSTSDGKLLAALEQLQGLPTHMAWMGAGGVWPSESLNVGETYLRRGNIDKTVSLLISTLNHTYTTDTFREEIKVDKSMPVACASGVSKEVENGYGTGDQPEAWGPANLILLVRDMIFYEEHDTLHILAGIPADWIAPGEHLAISSAPTTLGGRVSLRLEYPESGRMRLHVESSVAVPKAIVRFPLPAGKSLRSVSVNGQPATGYARDTLNLKNVNGPTDIEVHF